jgi:hypothetical protein
MLKNISYLKLGSETIQVIIDGNILNYEGTESDIDEIIELVKQARDGNEEAFHQMEDMVSGVPRPYFGDFKLNHDGEMFFRNYAEEVSPALAARVTHLKEANDTKTLAALENFQSRLMLNRDPQSRTDLYYFLEKNEMVITPKGYFLSYKAVAKSKKKVDPRVQEYIQNHSFADPTSYLVEVQTKEGSVFQNVSFASISMSHRKQIIPTFDNDPKITDYTIYGRIDGLHNEVENNTTGIFLDKHSGKIEQRLGDLVVMPRSECDNDPHNSCSHGLHVGNPEYVNSFGSSDDVVLIALVSPTDVIAVPSEDARKMRVCQYFIAGFSEMNNGQIVPIENLLYEDDFEEKELAKVEEELKNGNFERYILPNEKPDEEEIQKMREIIAQRMNRIHAKATV